ncbi:uncharacterized protein LOC108204426 isoform X3 [Daucus carota subsp. sativus]|uniref:uncharacterized protein LOC108204426 isoform X3 n=1 Tax=Daucus carota subsp. sativus TaxID=79200 RepID=UPI0007F0209E|nr:PREDICTED: uncharacterized protein LOC108204426 isoform X3 [Daucus carota subsp. sativus]
MYARKLNSKYKKWGLISQQYKHVAGSDRSFGTCCKHTAILSNCSSRSVSTRRYISSSSLFRNVICGNTKLRVGSNANWSSSWLRYYSSEGDGRNANEDKCVPLKDVSDTGSDKIKTEKLDGDISLSDGHARLGEQDQKDWLHNEKITIENKRKEYPFLSRREKFKKEFSRRIVPWDKITVSWKTFPYFLHEHTKKLLVECTASHLKHKDCAAAYGSGLTSSSGRILLQSIPGTELYRERVVRALAQDLQVPLLVLDSSVLAPYDFGEECLSESESDEDNAESGAETTSDTEIEDENDASNEEDWTSSGEAKSDGDAEGFDARAAAVEAALNKLVPGHLEDFEKNVMGTSESSPESPEKEASKPSDEPKRQLKKGDRVKYVGPSRTEADNRPLSTGQRGVVCEMNGNVALVLLENSEKETGDASSDKISANHALHWIQAKDITYDLDAEAEDCYVAMEALSEVLHSVQPLIVYFPDFSIWLSRAVTKANRKAFAQKVQEIFDQVSGPVVLICGQNKGETGSKEKEKYVSSTMILPNLGRLAKLPLSLKRLTEGLKPAKKSEDDEIYKLFTNVMVVHPPKEEDPLRTFNKQIEEDRRIVISRSNITELHKVLEENGLLCVDLLHVNADGVILTKSKAEKVVGWAKNHYLSSCLLPLIKGEKLYLPKESLEIALSRLKEQELISKKPSHTLKNLAKDEYESNFVSAVVPPDEVGVKFDDIGALEDVKTALNELVILPMRRPELFSRGNLLRPCKGILLFGPPGTGKTLLAKALATEAGANFISITGSTLTSKWFGDAEKLTKALFSFAGKLAPVIIFVDEVDSLLGARGGSFEHEATRRMRNEFMAAWDGLRTKDSQRILILGATNRPFDLDDAVIRRLPRRIYVDLPDAENRLKILKIFLDQEDLEPEFQMQQLANATEGYSGSDLKNLCRAAAYRPVQELLEKERKGVKDDVASILRPLNLDDFIQSKAKVGPSVAFDAASMNELRKWNEQYGEGGSRRKSPFGFGN